jgi:tetratricopeptide (TPR) repeat protein
VKVEQIVEEFLKLLFQEEVEQAEELVIEEARGREDEVASSFLEIGAVIGDEGNHVVAFLCFEVALRVVKSENLEQVICQGLAIAHNNYAVLLKEMKRYTEAESHYKESLEINPEDADAHYNYAILLYEMKRYTEAESHYKESLEINPDYAESCGNLGILYSEQKRYPEAVKSFERASDIFKRKEMSLDHKRAEALKFSIRARITWRKESWEDTRKFLEKVVENFETCGMEEKAETSRNILFLLTIDESFVESLTPRDLFDLRDRIQELRSITLEFKRALEESETYEHRVFAAKFACIQFLSDALTFQPLDFEDLDNARKTLRDEGFPRAVESLNVLEIFATDLQQYESVGLENIPEDEAKILLRKLTSMRYLDGYISAGTISDIQTLEPWKKPVTPIEYIDFKMPSKTSVKAGIVQFSFDLESSNTPRFPPKPEHPHVLKEQVLNYLEIAVKEGLDMVCFPELSMTPDILKTIKKKEIGDLLIIGGSYYTKRMNVCPIIYRKKVRTIQKIHPSKFEFTPVKGKGMIPGDRLYLFDTHAGKFIVLVCEDFRHEINNVLSQINDLDFIIVISYNPSPERFHSLADSIPSNYPMYILMSNVSEKGSEFGKSCIFGIIDDSYKGDLEREGLRPKNSYENEVAEIRGDGMLIEEFNIAQKTIGKPTPLDFWTIKDIQKINP